jgi:hypothetical protein
MRRIESSPTDRTRSFWEGKISAGKELTLKEETPKPIVKGI